VRGTTAAAELNAVNQRRKTLPPERNEGVYALSMAWVKVPPENHPIFRAALPKDPRVETMAMFGGIAAKVNGNIFAGLFGRSTMVWLPEDERAEALALPGAAPFDPMGDGRARSDKVMLPEELMQEPAELRRWIARAFDGAALLPAKLKAAKKKAAPRASKAPPVKKKTRR
jgi:TfoX/Sxy family transcriptional regulator of competence genes